MNRRLLGLLLFAVAVTASAPLEAQHPHVGVAGGAVLPLGNYGDFDNTGWHLLGYGEFELPASPLSVRIDALYGKTSHDTLVAFEGKTTLGGGSGNLVWHAGPATAPARAYLLAGVGMYVVRVSQTSGPSSSETKVAADAGAGVTIRAGGVSLFAEARFISVLTSERATNFVPISAGVSFSLR